MVMAEMLPPFPWEKARDQSEETEQTASVKAKLTAAATASSKAKKVPVRDKIKTSELTNRLEELPASRPPLHAGACAWSQCQLLLMLLATF